MFLVYVTYVAISGLGSGVLAGTLSSTAFCSGT